jgi:ABC-type multidrug transport system ATPase subunit
MIKLKLNSLGKHYNQRWVFKDLNFESDNPIIGISGTNGSGKSTLLKILSGLVQSDAGKVNWDNFPSPGQLDMRRDSGFAAPYIQLYGDLTCRENLEFLRSASDNIPEADYLDTLAFEFGIPEKLDRPYKSLSSGQQQRIKILSAIQSNPAILFLDEPGTNLDENGIEFIRKIIEHRRNNREICIVASNQRHELDLCDEIIALERRD